MVMSRLTRYGTAEPVSRDQILRRERGQGSIHFPCSTTTSKIGNLIRLIHTLAICVTIHTRRPSGLVGNLAHLTAININISINYYSP